MSGHYCLEHKVVFFKKGAMKGYAHPIEGTEPTEWCNEPEEGGAPIPEGVKAKTSGGYKVDPAKITSIERQSALKSAVTWCGIKVQAGKDIRTTEVITVAVLFESYLEHGATVEKKPE